MIYFLYNKSIGIRFGYNLLYIDILHTYRYTFDIRIVGSFVRNSSGICIIYVRGLNFRLLFIRSWFQKGNWCTPGSIKPAALLHTYTHMSS